MSEAIAIGATGVADAVGGAEDADARDAADRVTGAAGESVYAAFRARADAHPDKTALIAGDGSACSYAELDARVRALARALRPDAGAPSTPRLLLAEDGPATVALALAASASGTVLAPVNPGLGIGALGTAMRAIGADTLLHDAATAAKAEAVRDAVAADGATPCRLLAIERAAAAEAPPCRLPATRPPGAGDGAPPPDARDRPLLLTLSSGSTGDPKPVVFTDRGKLERALHTAAEFGVDESDTVLCASPFFHSLGQRLTFMPLVLGATLVHLPRFSPRAWVEAVHAHAVTFTICVSSHLFALKGELTAGDAPQRSLRALVSSSAAIDLDTKRRLFEQDGFDFHEMYGASEVATATRLDRADARERIGSVGRPCRGVRLRIVDAGGRALPPGIAGEIQVASPLASPGYHARPDLSAAAWTDGWFRTGDHGYLDEDGYLYFVDRLSDVIVSGGSKVYPSDVESSLRGVVGVDDCLVVGVADGYLGEAVVAVIRSGDGDTRALERALRHRARETLAPVQRPLAYLFVGELPLNGAGKIDRKSVRARCNALELDLGTRFCVLQTAGERAA